MRRPLFSASWHRVRGLRPRLRSHAEVHRQIFRGEVWYVVEDHATGAYQRISEAGYRLVGLMDGRRTVDDIWRAAGERLGDSLPTQDETIDLLARLHDAELLEADIPADLARVVARSGKKTRKRQLASVRNPLAIRIPLIDPDRLIGATLWAVRPLLGWFGAMLWLAVVGTGLVLAGLHFDALTRNMADRVLAADNLLLLAAVYPLVKALHELGHAYAVKRWGGEVHEIGVMLLVFMPVPYVDATASSAFRNKWRRAGVAAAGILVETFLAGLAMILWTSLEPGLARAAALNVMLLAGVSTVLFNGNPLLRFDGYYVLADLIEIPNLGPRSNQHLIYLIQRHLLGIEDARSPAMAPGEAAWFVVYGIGSLLYRLAIMAAIALFVASQFFEVGLLLAFWTMVLLVAIPAIKGLWFVLTSPRLDGRRGRAVVVSAAGLAAFGWLLFGQPAPQATMAEGVVWAPERVTARAGASGFVAELLAEPAAVLAPGDPILRVEDRLLDVRIAVLEARIQELELRRLAAASDPAQVDLAGHELRLAQEELSVALDLRGERVLRAETAGALLLPAGEELVGRFVRKGDLLAWVLGPGDAVIRVAVPQEDVDLVRRRMQGVSIRLASDLATVREARIVRADPAATYRLPSPALGAGGGGPIALDPTRPEGEERSLESLFLFDIVPVGEVPLGNLGERVHVRFSHGDAPLGAQAWRSLRQLFLRDLNV